MPVSETIVQEAVFLGTAILAGAGLFFLYDILRIFRRIVPHGNIWIGAEDFLYWLVCTGVVFVMLYQENDGMVRGFALGGVILGMFLYILLLSRLVVKVNTDGAWVSGKSAADCSASVPVDLEKSMGLFQKTIEKVYPGG